MNAYDGLFHSHDIETLNNYFFLRFRQLNSIIKYLCFSLVPLAAIASLSTHFLVQYGHIQMTDGSGSAKQIIEAFNRKIADAKPQRHITDVGIGSPEKPSSKY